jgi:hypothetical protein
VNTRDHYEGLSKRQMTFEWKRVSGKSRHTSEVLKVQSDSKIGSWRASHVIGIGNGKAERERRPNNVENYLVALEMQKCVSRRLFEFLAICTLTVRFFESFGRHNGHSQTFIKTTSKGDIV